MKASDSTLLRLIAYHLGLTEDTQGNLTLRSERMLRPIEGTAYTASSVLPRPEETPEEVDVEAEIAKLEGETVPYMTLTGPTHDVERGAIADDEEDDFPAMTPEGESPDRRARARATARRSAAKAEAEADDKPEDKPADEE